MNDFSKGKSEDTEKSLFHCKVCDKRFNSRENLNAHKKSEHPKKINCKYCDDIFDQTYKLEKHLEKHKNKEFKCEQCEKQFHLEWRLKKHQISHELKTMKNCHYFNNEKPCPFEEIGCMFRHEKSDKCKFNKLCKNKLCPYQHENQTLLEKEKEPNETGTDNIEKIDSEDDSELICDSDSDNEDLECDTCGKIFKNGSELSEHNMNDICGYGCEDCGAYYRYEEYLKLHMEKHCTKCCDEFSPKDVLEAHKKICLGLQY